MHRIRMSLFAIVVTISLPTLSSVGYGGVVDLSSSIAPGKHATDGTFTTTDEWTGPNVSSQTFAQVLLPNGQLVGGATLYVEQGQGGNSVIFIFFTTTGAARTFPG